jgi:arylsulfatase A-like enzyme
MTGRYPQRAGLSTIIVGVTPNTLQANEVTLGKLFKGQGFATGIVGKWHLGASEQSWPTRQGFDEYHVGVLETTDSTLYRDAMQRAGLPEAVVAAVEPGIYESDANGNLNKVRPYNVEYRRQVEGDISRSSRKVAFSKTLVEHAENPFFAKLDTRSHHRPQDQCAGAAFIENARAFTSESLNQLFARTRSPILDGIEELADCDTAALLAWRILYEGL